MLYQIPFGICVVVKEVQNYGYGYAYKNKQAFVHYKLQAEFHFREQVRADYGVYGDGRTPPQHLAYLNNKEHKNTVCKPLVGDMCENEPCKKDCSGKRDDTEQRQFNGVPFRRYNSEQGDGAG